MGRLGLRTAEKLPEGLPLGHAFREGKITGVELSGREHLSNLILGVRPQVFVIAVDGNLHGSLVFPWPEQGAQHGSKIVGVMALAPHGALPVEFAYQPFSSKER